MLGIIELKRTVSLQPAMMIVMQVRFGALFELAGVALATPLTAVLTVPITMLYVQDVPGEQVKTPSQLWPASNFPFLPLTLTVAAMTPEHLQLLLTREMPYGKYKGRVIADLPGHYLGWFAREGFPRGEIGELLALMYELDHNALRSLLDPLRGRR